MTSPEDDAELAAFESTFRELHAPLCEVVESYVRSQAIAEEIVQDLFFVLWMRRRTLVTTSIRGYLFTSARNRALHHLRHQSLVTRLGRMFEGRPEVAGTATTRVSAQVALEAAEDAAALRRAIDALPARTRLAMVLQHDHEMTQVQIAEAMGISIKGVEKLLAVARLKLRDQLLARA